MRATIPAVLSRRVVVRLMRAVARLTAASIGFGAACAAHALPITLTASGQVDFIQEDEYGTASPLPTTAVPILPLFEGAKRVIASFTYDPALVNDLDASQQAGQYITPGTFTVWLPDIGKSFMATGNLGFSAYTAGEFHVNGNVTSFFGDFGPATPFSASFVFYRPMANDSLPAALGAWSYGNVHILFQGVEPYRDIVIGVAPVPEPSTAVMLLTALVAGVTLRVFRPMRKG